jgi:hypothetical protein
MDRICAQAGGISIAAGLDHRLDVLDRLAQHLAGQAALVRLHPVDVALEGVDLAVVGQHAERLGQPPGGEGVGRVALVKDREVGDETLVEQVREEGGELLGQEHALVDHRAAGQRADVEVLDRLRLGRLLDAPADDVEIDLELLGGDAAAVGDHDLLDLGPGGVGLFADHLGVHRHLAPAVDRVAADQDLALDDDPAALLGAQVGARQEDHADRDAPGARLVAGARDVLVEEVLGDLNVDAGAVAGLAVGVDRTAVPDRLQGLDAGHDHLAARLAVDRGDQADAAGVVLLGRVVEPHAGQTLGLGAPVVNVVRTVVSRLDSHGQLNPKEKHHNETGQRQHRCQEATSPFHFRHVLVEHEPTYDRDQGGERGGSQVTKEISQVFKSGCFINLVDRLHEQVEKKERIDCESSVDHCVLPGSVKLEAFPSKAAFLLPGQGTYSAATAGLVSPRTLA